MNSIIIRLVVYTCYKLQQSGEHLEALFSDELERVAQALEERVVKVRQQYIARFQVRPSMHCMYAPPAGSGGDAESSGKACCVEW